MALPTGFVYLQDVDASIIQEMKYYTHDNFLGRPVKGYERGACILTKAAATALAAVQKQLRKQSLSLKVFDCYRPQMAVEDFIVWSRDVNDQKMKASFYPNVNKADFFKLGYVAEKSAHTRGSTADLTIVQLSKTGQPTHELEMGTKFDFMDERSHFASRDIHGEAKAHRELLRKVMQDNGFEPYEYEWWDFGLADEPFPETYFNFPVR